MKRFPNTSLHLSGLEICPRRRCQPGYSAETINGRLNYFPCRKRLVATFPCKLFSLHQQIGIWESHPDVNPSFCDVPLCLRPFLVPAVVLGSSWKVLFMFWPNVNSQSLFSSLLERPLDQAGNGYLIKKLVDFH